MNEKWEICNVVLEEITYETQGIVDSVCYYGSSSLDVDDIWDLFESLAYYQWQFECDSESIVFHYLPSYDLHTQSPW